ncbi:MAG: hypothetical protein JW819_02780 [Candidatus Krumholzibacteriota bacterium]|nr:hypothetical protein [Candidatus Krumholzibacteriota bacterium]
MTLRVMTACLCCLLIAPLAAQACSVDLFITSVDVYFEREGTLGAQVGFVLKNLDLDDALESDITVFLDGDSAKAVPVVVFPSTTEFCNGEYYPDCDGICDPVYDGEEDVFGLCVPEQIDPGNLQCVCSYEFVTYCSQIPYNGESVVTIVIDYQGAVQEWFESNNEVSVPAPMTPAIPLSWTIVREYYR